jgi:hypothetical protein
VTDKPKTGTRKLAARPANDGNAARLADVLYELLKETGAHVGVERVLPPTADNRLAVRFLDGRDVVVRFEEV